MRIVHAPTEIAGQMGILVDGLRQKGHQAVGYNWFHTYLNYRSNVIKTEAYELKKVIDPILHHTDIFHLHNGNSFLHSNWDVPLLHGAGKPMVMHHWGNDVRTLARNQLLNPYTIPSSYLSDEQIIDRLKLLSRYIRHAIVQDYELYPHVSDYYEHVHVLPLACKVSSISYSYPKADNLQPVIIHAPTNRDFKGSAYVEKAVQDLKGTSTFTFETIEKLSHQEAMRRYLKADIVVDQILCGTYGMLSVEAMAMGKVVVAYVRDDVRRHMPEDMPIIVANPDTIREVLADLLKNPEKRHSIGVASRAYVQKHHGVERVIAQLLNIYSVVTAKEVE